MRIAIVGATGLVGRELLSLFEKSTCVIDALFLFAKKTASLSFREQKLPVHPLSKPVDCNYVFFCTSSEISKKHIPEWLKTEATIIDLSSAYRQKAPLIIPEINPHCIKLPLISSPNCTTTIMLLALAPLHRKFGLKRVVVSTYQAASGGGKALLHRLIEETRACPDGHSSYAFNLFPHSEPNEEGYNEEELKMIAESHRILEDDSIAISSSCIRVPTLRAHALSLNVELQSEFSLSEIKDLLRSAPRVKYFPGADISHATASENIYVSRVRVDISQENTIDMWILGDQLLKGASLNAFDLYKHLESKRVSQ